MPIARSGPGRRDCGARAAADRVHYWPTTIVTGMGIINGLRNFWRAFRTTGGDGAPRHSGHSLADAVKDSTQVGGSLGHGMAGSEGQHKIVAESHEAYDRSKKRDS